MKTIKGQRELEKWRGHTFNSKAAAIRLLGLTSPPGNTRIPQRAYSALDRLAARGYVQYIYAVIPPAPEWDRRAVMVRVP